MASHALLQSLVKGNLSWMPPRTASVIPAICGVAEPRNSGAIAAFCALHLIQHHGALHRAHPRQVALGKASQQSMKGCIGTSKRFTHRSRKAS